jgi:TRAP-type C4-dicarboxylate transport system substrate-binding protein
LRKVTAATEMGGKRMSYGIERRQFALGAAAIASVGLISRPVRAAETFKLRCSLDTAPAHMRNVSIGDFLGKLEKASEGRIKTELFSAGALFKDSNVAKALVQGQVEMACPGTWVLTGFVSDCDFASLPMMYGLDLETVRKVVDGKTGAMINAQMLKRLHLKVLGPWLELGAQHWFSATKPITSFADLKGMKIRNAGGAALAWRTRFFDAIPNTTAWPDVPLALSQGTFDGLITTNESCFSAKLWEAGVKSSFQDHQNINEYVPMVSERFYTSLPADLQKLLVDTWAANIGQYRINMGNAQEHALGELKSHNVAVTVASADEIAAIRKKMVADQPKLVKELKMTADLPKVMAADIG